MEDNNMTRDENLDKVLDFLEGSHELSAADIQEMLADGEACREIEDFLDCKQAMQKHYSHPAPDVESEWKCFMANKELDKVPEYTDDDDKPSFWSKHRQVFLGGAIGIAATLLCLLGFSWYHDMQQVALPDGLVVYEAKDAPQEIMLQTADDEAVPISDNQNGAHIPQLVSAKGGSSLNYHSNVNNGKPSVIQLLTTPVGKDYKVTLSDGTCVYLNADSRLEYPSRFEGKERVVTLEGEAYFDVAKDAKHPFVVKTDQMETRVLGTKFNVANYMGKFSRITLIEGSVNVTGRKDGKCVRMVPGDEVVVYDDGKMTKASIDVDGYVYWQEDFFYFDNQPLSEIMQSIGRWYNVNVVFVNKEAMNYRFHYLCERKAGIDHAIHLLNRMKNLQITRQGETVIVK